MATSKFRRPLDIFCFITICILEITTCEEYELDLYGGHSREFRDIDEPVIWDSLHESDSSRLRRNAIPTTPGFPTDEEIHDFIDSYKEPLETLKANMKNLLANEWISITYRLKGFSSLKEKLLRKNYTLSQIHDTMGFRLTLQTVSDVRRVQILIRKNASSFLFVEQERCYGMCPDATETYRDDGYRRIHMLVTTTNRTKWAELQLATPYTSMWSDWNHEFLYKGKFSSTHDSSVKEYAKQVAEYLYRLDGQRDVMPSCPLILKTANASGTLPPEIYEMLHEQPNLCFFWTDVYLSQPLVVNNGLSSQSKGSVIVAWYTLILLLCGLALEKCWWMCD